MRTEILYLERDVMRNLKTAAILRGLDGPDAMADVMLREALGAIPALVERGQRIAKAIKDEAAQWDREHKPTA